MKKRYGENEGDTISPPITSGKTDMVRHHILGLIDAGLAPHDRLPTERQVTIDLSVSRVTVRQALADLESDGVLYRIQGAGTYVAPKRILKTLELSSFSEDMHSRGLVPGSASVLIERRYAGPQLSYRLHVAPSEEIVKIERVRTADGEAICLERAYFRGDVIPKALALGTSDSLYAKIANQGIDLQPHHAHQEILATVLQEDDAAKLGVPPFSAALVVERTVFNIRNESIEFTRSAYRSDRFSFEITVDRAVPSAPHYATKLVKA